MHDMCYSRLIPQIIYVFFFFFFFDYRYGTNRPWTIAAKRLNPPGKKRRKVFVEPIANEEWHVLRGDTVSDPLCVYE